MSTTSNDKYLFAFGYHFTGEEINSLPWVQRGVSIGFWWAEINGCALLKGFKSNRMQLLGSEELARKNPQGADALLVKAGLVANGKIDCNFTADELKAIEAEALILKAGEIKEWLANNSISRLVDVFCCNSSDDAEEGSEKTANIDSKNTKVAYPVKSPTWPQFKFTKISEFYPIKMQAFQKGIELPQVDPLFDEFTSNYLLDAIANKNPSWTLFTEYEKLTS